VAVEALLEVKCPLTDWEDDLRALLKKEGEQAETRSFTERVVIPLLVPEFHQEKVKLPLVGEIWVLDILYYGFALLVLLSFILAPPGRRAPRGQLAFKLACRAPPGSNGRQGRTTRAEVLVGRP